MQIPRAVQPWLFLAPALLLVGGVLLLPLGVGISYAFMGMSADNLFGEAGFAGLDNFRALAADAAMGRVLANTAVWTLSSLLLQCGLGLGLALLLRHSGSGVRRLQALLFLPWAVPSVLIGLVWKMLLSPQTSPLPKGLAALGLLSGPVDLLADPQWALLGPVLANVWFGIPFFAITLLAALQAIPHALYEAAALDGASPWQGFSRITLPLILPHAADHAAAAHGVDRQLRRPGVDHDAGWPRRGDANPAHLPVHAGLHRPERGPGLGAGGGATGAAAGVRGAGDAAAPTLLSEAAA